MDDRPPDIGVVIIDDHRMFAESLGRLLADSPGVSIIGVADRPQEGIDLAARTRPDVALVDYQMPGADGVEVTRRLKAIDPDIQVIMLTGQADERLLLEAVQAGCSGFLTKDRAAAEVEEAVRTVAAGEALISPAMLARLLPRLGREPEATAAPLTAREMEVLRLVATGMTNRAIAAELFLSVNTVRNYVQSLLNKLGAHSKLEAVSIAVRAGLLDYGSG